MRPGTKMALSIGALALCLFILLLIPYHSLIGLKDNADHSGDELSAELQMRFDLLARLLEIGELRSGAAGKALEHAVEAHRMHAQASNLPAKVRANQLFQVALDQLWLATKGLPGEDDSRLPELQKQLVESEARVAELTQAYDQAADRFNQAIGGIPAGLVARLLDYRPLPLLHPAIRE